jgi:hypothetical protein
MLLPILTAEWPNIVLYVLSVYYYKEYHISRQNIIILGLDQLILEVRLG